MSNKTAIVAGATGLVGNEILKQLVQNHEYKKIYVLARRAPSIHHEKIEVILTNFENLDTLLFNNKVDNCYCALGTTTKKSGKKGLFTVDYTYVVHLALLCETLNVSNFLVVSSQGANSKSLFHYMRTKGMMEDEVKKKSMRGIYIIKPSLITGKRNEKRMAEKAGYYIYKLFSPLMIGKLKKLKPIHAEKIAKCMIYNAKLNKPGVHTIESDVIQTF